MDVTLAYRAHAKINLYLDVLSKRRDGYHNIETVFQSVGLADELTLSERPSRISLACSIPELDSDENLVFRAATLLRERSGCNLGAHIVLDKAIPIAAGLAGGSTDAAATLIALNHLWELGLSLADLFKLARELGSDVPYCLIGGTVAATGRGEHLIPITPLPTTWFVLLHPKVTVSTARIYGSPKLALSPEKPFAAKTPSFRKALRALDRGDLGHVLFNRMDEPVFAAQPHLALAKQRLLDEGCIAAAMSGSGATLFGVCESRKHANKVAEAFTDHSTSVVPTVPASVERI